MYIHLETKTKHTNTTTATPRAKTSLPAGSSPAVPSAVPAGLTLAGVLAGPDEASHVGAGAVGCGARARAGAGAG
jgi:hypothetical protein